MKEAVISQLATSLSQLSSTIYGDRFAIVAHPNSTIEIQASQSPSQEIEHHPLSASIADNTRVAGLSITLIGGFTPNEYLKGMLTDSPLIESWGISDDQLLIRTKETHISTVTLLLVGVLMTNDALETLQINLT